MRVFQVEDAWSMDNVRLGTRPDAGARAGRGAPRDAGVRAQLPRSARAGARVWFEAADAPAHPARRRGRRRRRGGRRCDAIRRGRPRVSDRVPELGERRTRRGKAVVEPRLRGRRHHGRVHGGSRGVRGAGAGPSQRCRGGDPALRSRDSVACPGDGRAREGRRQGPRAGHRRGIALRPAVRESARGHR